MLEGRQINLRLIRTGEADSFFDLINRYADRGAHLDVRLLTPARMKDLFGDNASWWKDDCGLLMITDKQDRLLGWVAFFKAGPHDHGYEVGYEILRRTDRGHGYGTAALRMLSAYLFAWQPIERLQVCTLADNAASLRIAEKCGYQREGTLRRQGFVRGRYVDVAILSLLREDAPDLDEALRT